MQVEELSIDVLIPYYGNAKVHQAKLNVLKSSIKRFGFDQPIVVDEDMVILKGHGRRLAALGLNLKTVPVVVRKGMSEDRKKIMRIADNKIFEKTSVDTVAVADELRGMIEDGVKGLSDFYNLSEYNLSELSGVPEKKPTAPSTHPKVVDKSGSGEGVPGDLVKCPVCGDVSWESK